VLKLCREIWHADPNGKIPDPREVMMLDLEYVRDLIAFDQGVQFYLDYGKRPAHER
jgi:hypothetical protein